MNKKDLKFPFIQWFNEFQKNTPVLNGDKTNESLSNHYSFSLTESDKKKIMINDIVIFFEAVIFFIKHRVVELRKVAPYKFYSWYDEMADSLNFSLVSGTINEPLPFRCEVKLISSIEQVCSDFLKGKAYIPFDELTEIEWEDPEDEVNDHILTVYVCEI